LLYGIIGFMASTKRAANRAAMTAEIGRLGREHLSTHGAAQLSLRAIAREMGIASSAVYRYVPSRDDLLTLLLVEAYNDLAASVEKALGGGADPRADIGRGALAMRSWAVVDPARWALLYGSPVPGYAAPAGQTVGPGTRAVRAFLQTLDAAQRGGLLRADLPTPDDPLVPELVAVAADFDLELSDAAVLAATALWATIIGAISLEVFGQYGSDSFGRPEVLFTGQIDLVLRSIFQ
jgi:AcrR family transcriptional regulator